MTAPSELNLVGLDTSRFRKSDTNEWHGPCPRCGGKDRFVVHTSRDWPHWFMWCRPGAGHCGWAGWADQLNPALKSVTDDEREKWAKQRAEAEAQEKKQRAARLAEFTTSELWIELHRRMGQQARQWWEKQGIPADVQAQYYLGYDPKYFGGAYSIPYFDDEYNPVNIQYRLVKPPREDDRYRWGGLGYASYYTCYPGAEFDKAVICEGAKKAIVFAHHIAQGKIQVLAVPSKSSFAGIEQAAKQYRRVYVMLDPDAMKQATQLASDIGNHVRIVNLPNKADDMILLGYGAEYFRAMFTTARTA